MGLIFNKLGSVDKMELSGKTVAITGATGFVGGRLAERLSLSEGQIKVRGLVHDPFNAARLARLPVETAFGDVTSLDSMRKFVQGCEIVVHCAIGTPYVTVKGTENVIRAALEHNVKKFVHISSTAIYGYSPSSSEVRNEKPDYRAIGDAYCDSKIRSEKMAFYFHRAKKLPLVVIRPANIFGPYSKPWTIRPIDMLKSGCYVLIDGGNSPSNMVYIDNVIDAIQLAITHDNAIGHALTITNNEPTTWKEFFAAYANMFAPPLPLLNLQLKEVKIERANQLRECLKEILLNPNKLPPLFPIISHDSELIKSLSSLIIKSIPRSQAVKLISRLPEAIKTRYTRISKEKSIPGFSRVPDDNFVKLFTSQVQFPIRNAIEIIGYRPRVSFERGMGLTKKWLDYQRLL